MKESFVTFDGKFWDKEEILCKMVEDDFYYGYLGKNALSSSSVKKLLDSPKAYKNSLQYSTKETAALIMGRLVHLAVLEPEKFFSLNIVDVSSRNTKLFKEELSKEPNTFTHKEYISALSLSESIQANNEASGRLDGLNTEVPAVGYINDLPFRAKADSIGKGRIVDLKTTNDIRKFRWSAKDLKYACQLYIYCKLFKVSYESFEFLVIDKNTHDVGLFGVSGDFYSMGENMVEQACEVYHHYFSYNKTLELNQYIIKGTL